MSNQIPYPVLPLMFGGGFRIGRSVKIAAVCLLLFADALAVGLNAASQAASPQAALLDYLGALERGDTSAAWAVLAPAPAPSGADVQLLTRSDLGAVLAAHPRPMHSHVRVMASTSSGNEAIVNLRFDVEGAGQAAVYRLRQDPNRRAFGLYPAWKVVPNPVLLSLQLPAGSGRPLIDGRTLPAPQGRAITVAVFPGQHRVVVPGTPLFAATSLALYASEAATDPLSVVPDPGLTPAALASGAAAVQAALTSCSQTTPAPSGCPVGSWSATSRPEVWSVIGTPDLVISSDPSGQISAEGHVVADAHSAVPWPSHYVMSTSFRAGLMWDGTEMRFQGFVNGLDVQPQAAPPVGKATVLEALTRVFAGCISDPVLFHLDCPTQAVVPGTVSNARWTADSDPMAGAKVAFDGNGLFRVSGNYVYTVSCDQLLNGVTRHLVGSKAGPYEADFYWDGARPVFVTFNEE